MTSGDRMVEVAETPPAIDFPLTLAVLLAEAEVTVRITSTVSLWFSLSADALLSF